MKIKELLETAAVGYIAKNKKEAGDPRYSMSITQDVKPGEVERQAKKFGNKVPPPLLHSSAAKNSTPNKLMNLGLTESVVLDESRGVFARQPGDPFVGDDGQAYEFVNIVTYPKVGQFKDDRQLKSAVAKTQQQNKDIVWTNAEGKNLSFAIATFAGKEGDTLVYGRFFPQIEGNGGMLKKWKNTDLPGLRYSSASAKKEQSGLKPQVLLQGKSTFNSGSELLNYTYSLNSLSKPIKKGIAMIGNGEMPMFIGEHENLPTIRDNLGEIIQVLCLTHNVINSKDAEIAKETVLLGADFSECSIEFPEGENAGLVDSYLYANGRKLGISSKGNKGANASMKNLVDTLAANPEIKKKIPKITRDVLDIITKYSAKEAPLVLAQMLELINAKNANEIRQLLEGRVQNDKLLSPWAKKYVQKYSSEKKMGWNYGNWLLANVAKQVTEKLNSNAQFQKGCLLILNNSGIIQMYSNAVTKDGNVVFKDFRIVYPPKFTGNVYMDAGKNYFANDVKGKLSFGFSKPTEPKNVPADEKPSIMPKRKKPADITAAKPRLKNEPKGVGRSKRK
jgi:hypothetical protein